MTNSNMRMEERLEELNRTVGDNKIGKLEKMGADQLWEELKKLCEHKE